MGIVCSSPQSIAARLRKDVSTKYETAAPDLYEILSRVPHRYSFGKYDQSVGNAKYAHKSDAIATPRSIYPLSALSKSQLYRHLLTSSKSDYVWYVNALPLLKGNKVALLQIDIDDHGKSGDAHELLSCLLLQFPFLSSSYIEASTNGFGIHLYFVVAFPLYMTHKAIKQHILDFQSVVSSFSTMSCQQYSIKSVCHEVRGTPCVRDGDSFTQGSLVKFPRVDSEQSALVLVSLFESPIDYSKLCASTVATTSTTITKEEREEGTSPNSETIDIESETDAFNRTLKLASQMMRRFNRVIDCQELLEEYAKRYPHAGPQSRKREARARQVVAKLSKTFIPNNKASGNPLMYAQELRERVTPEMIARHFSSKRSTLKVEDIALVLFLLKENANAAMFARLPKKYFLSASRKLKEESKIDRTLDDKRIAASKRILAELGYLKTLKHGNQFVGTSEYIVRDVA
jgi:hypothetical protein